MAFLRNFASFGNTAGTRHREAKERVFELLVACRHPQPGAAARATLRLKAECSAAAAAAEVEQENSHRAKKNLA